jgi:hypothetical protein
MHLVEEFKSVEIELCSAFANLIDVELIDHVLE